MRPDIKPGSAPPDYELPDHENVPRRRAPDAVPTRL
jgi:hypothetical protein